MAYRLSPAQPTPRTSAGSRQTAEAQHERKAGAERDADQKGDAELKKTAADGDNGRGKPTIRPTRSLSVFFLGDAIG